MIQLDSFGGTENSVYDADNLLDSRSYTGQGESLLATFVSDAEGMVTSQADFASGTSVATMVTGYDGDGNILNMHEQTADSTVNFVYEYDQAGQLTLETDNGCAPVSYTYDATGQLISAGTVGYNYDLNGNPTNTGDTTGVDNELLTYVDPTTGDTIDLSYDHAGNETLSVDTTANTTWAYAYDNDNHLISAVETNSSNQTMASVAYEYDVFGNRIEMTTTTYATAGYVPSATTSTVQYAIDQWNPGVGIGAEDAEVWADLNMSSGLQTRYITTDQVDQLIGRVNVNGGTTSASFYLLDRQNSVRDVISSTTAALQDTICYDAYGNITWETSSMYGGVYKYTGREFDLETGLQYNRARYYDAAQGHHPVGGRG